MTEAAPSDAGSLAAWRSGDRSAFDALVARYEARLMSYLTHVAGSRAEAEDLFQETFLRVLKDPRGPEDGTPFAFYLLRIGRNLALTRRQRKTVERKALAAVGMDKSPGQEPVSPLADREMTSAVHAAVARLPEELREPVALKIWSGLAWREIGKLLGCSEDTAARRFAEALRLLGRDLGPTLGEGSR
jgi:RNA polymerase sigma-70 factor (ECF subfamily)